MKDNQRCDKCRQIKCHIDGKLVKGRHYGAGEWMCEECVDDIIKKIMVFDKPVVITQRFSVSVPNQRARVLVTRKEVRRQAHNTACDVADVQVSYEAWQEVDPIIAQNCVDAIEREYEKEAERNKYIDEHRRLRDLRKKGSMIEPITYELEDIGINIKCTLKIKGKPFVKFNCQTKYEDVAERVIAEILETSFSNNVGLVEYLKRKGMLEDDFS